MTYQAPIFESGLFGKANAFVCNSWTEAARAYGNYAEGIDWAQREMMAGKVMTRFLAKITSASIISTNRWSYSFVPFSVDSSHAPQIVDGDFATGSGALNLREIVNTSTVVDGSPVDASVEIGPFGSTYQGTSWSEQLNGYAEVVVSHRTDGSVLFWFSEQNPSRCVETAPAPPPQEEGQV